MAINLFWIEKKWSNSITLYNRRNYLFLLGIRLVHIVNDNPCTTAIVGFAYVYTAKKRFYSYVYDTNKMLVFVQLRRVNGKTYNYSDIIYRWNEMLFYFNDKPRPDKLLLKMCRWVFTGPWRLCDIAEMDS